MPPAIRLDPPVRMISARDFRGTNERRTRMHDVPLGKPHAAAPRPHTSVSHDPNVRHPVTVREQLVLARCSAARRRATVEPRTWTGILASEHHCMHDTRSSAADRTSTSRPWLGPRENSTLEASLPSRRRSSQRFSRERHVADRLSGSASHCACHARTPSPGKQPRALMLS